MMSIRDEHQGRPERPEVDWADLLKPEYKGKVALSGDPTQSNQAISAVWARRRSPTAARSTTSSPASTSSRSSTTWATSCRSSPSTATVASGETPIASPGPTTPSPTVTSWPATRPSRSSSRPTPSSAGMYVQAHQRLRAASERGQAVEEFLYSNEGQLIWLKGYCNPIRYDDLVARSVDPGRPGRQAARIRPGAVCRRSTRSPRRPTAITTGWPTTVGVTVK